jgi:hypothetical protein
MARIIISDISQEQRDFINNIVTQWNAFLTKLDTDATAQNAAVTASQLDTDYSATLAIADTVERN